ncbi:hypothetical protein AK812_SmicGene21374 [Symbiodinium microadriaticum]|uniref:Uncharacterized protein n=1 Tax=Symbiodinium microadriaticum TaxID=2951 RepID=A0A1Q9DML1_SYMMI|nr:hypothetical protein AK812_SmicGene21374 [Symbiodinium microadriaticum]
MRGKGKRWGSGNNIISQWRNKERAAAAGKDGGSGGRWEQRSHRKNAHRRDGLLLLLVLLGGLPMPLQPEKEDAWPYHTLKQAKLALKRLDLG